MLVLMLQLWLFSLVCNDCHFYKPINKSFSNTCCNLGKLQIEWGLWLFIISTIPLNNIWYKIFSFSKYILSYLPLSKLIIYPLASWICCFLCCTDSQKTYLSQSEYDFKQNQGSEKFEKHNCFDSFLFFIKSWWMHL